jgi:hypothetical protein
MARDIHILRIIYFIIALSTWLAGSAFYLYAEFTLQDPSAPVVLLLVIPSAFFAVLMMINVCIFPLRYSVFGKHERTMFPKESPQVEIRRSWIQVCRIHSSCPTVTWRVYPSGLGIEIWGFGKVFLPADFIVDVEKPRQRYFRVNHISRELRNPVLIPTKVFCAALEAWKEHDGV